MLSILDNTLSLVERKISDIFQTLRLAKKTSREDYLAALASGWVRIVYGRRHCFCNQTYSRICYYRHKRSVWIADRVKIPLLPNGSMESKIENNNNVITHVATKTWDAEVLKSDLPVMVDFWAEWCGPCRMVGPAVEQVGKILAGKVKVAKLNVDENQEIAMKYSIQSIPSLLLFKDGKEIARTIGAAPKEAYLKFIESSLKS